MTNDCGVKKVSLKVLNEKVEKVVWTHLCYMDENTYDSFLDTFKLKPYDLGEYIAVWALADFNVHLSMTTKRDIAILKALVLDRYSRVFPAMYNSNLVDSHGWMRVWITEKMEKELKYERNPRKR